ncbi:hypothetical protein MKX01_019773 [Papaver californicum]|nr:hypothetical protein MKX01_019773 [Papaver californicum]
MDQAHLSFSNSGTSSSSNLSQEEEFDFSDVVLNYINQILMEENNEHKNYLMSQDDYLALQSAEKPFYDILGEKYPTDCNPEGQTENFIHYNGSENAVETSWIDELVAYDSLFNTESVPSNFTFQAEATPRLSYNPSNSFNSVVVGLVESEVGKVQVPYVHSESEPIWQFRKGVQEANKFLPDDNNLIINLERNRFFYGKRNKEVSEARGFVAHLEKDVVQISPYGSREKKNVHREDMDLIGKSNKQLAAVQKAMFDMVLISNDEKAEKADSILRKSLKIQTSKNLHQNDGRLSVARNRPAKETWIPYSLMTASEQLKQLRQHSSPYGDVSRRLAHYFAYGLEARLAGSGSQIYSTLQHEMPSISNIFANQTIGNLAENATSLHIIDFGILYGFQWPCLIRRLSKRKGGPPKLRITGIELSLPGRRLRDYAKELNVPFEYHGIAQKWETIQLEDLKINKDELLVANCINQGKNLLDESVILDSPRDAVFNLIRKMNPKIFVHGIVNGTYNSPFFVSRFRDALFHFYSIFDVLETVVPQGCEGSDRVERPETYKQWQLRNIKAGFMQLLLNTHIMKKAKKQAISDYHKDFVIDEDSRWLLLGWKGRILFAVSSWRPM